MDGVKKKAVSRHSKDSARIARFYGISPFSLSRQQRRVLLSNLEPLQAEEILRENGGLKADSIKALTLLATGDKKAAEKAWTEAQGREQERRVFGG